MNFPHWKWMTHPAWNKGEPVPFYFEMVDGEVFYTPFNLGAATDFEWKYRDPAWQEVQAASAQASAAEQPVALSIAQHTPGRIKAFNLYATPEIRDQQDNFIATVKDGSDRAAADARRLVACWNACDGVSTKLLEESPAPFSQLRAERDELLEALKKASVVLACACVDAPQIEPHAAYAVVCAAIAKATGGAA